jgi:spermidine/putrescine transport system substrate-binding protein
MTKPQHPRGPLALDRRRILRLAAASGGLALLPAARARAETTVNWLGWQGYDEPLRLGSFLADNGIALATTYINSNEEIIARLSAGGAGQVDFITIYFGHIPILVAADLLEPIDEARVPGMGEIFPEFLEVDAIRRNGQLYAVPFTWGTLSLVYDPAAIPRPTSWRDILAEDLKGRIAMVNDMTGLICTWAPIATGSTTPTRLKPDELRQTIDFLIVIKTEHARTLSMSFGEAVDLFARGEVVASALGWDAMVGFAAEKGKVLDFVFPEEGVMVFMDTLAIPKGAPNLDLAYAMIGQSISPEGQAHLANELTQAVITRAAVPLVSERNRQIYQYDNLGALFERARFYPFWPLEPEGEFVTFDTVLEEWERFLQA